MLLPPTVFTRKEVNPTALLPLKNMTQFVADILKVSAEQSCNLLRIKIPELNGTNDKNIRLARLLTNTCHLQICFQTTESVPFGYRKLGYFCIPEEHKEKHLEVIAPQYSNKASSYSKRLIPSEITNISCKNCSAPLLKPDFYSLLETPNTYWLELLDCWMCHHDMELCFDKNTISPRGRKILINTTHILLSENQMDNVIKTQNNVAACGSCSCPIGQRAIRENDSIVIYFDKRNVILNVNLDICKEVTFDSFSIVFNKIIEELDANSCYRLILESIESDRKLIIQFWMVSLNVTRFIIKDNIKDEISFENIKDLWNKENCYKIMFKSHECEKWKNDEAVEILSFPRDMLSEFYDNLKINICPHAVAMEKGFQGNSLYCFMLRVACFHEK
ncbi:Ubiquitin-conjugating enzyme E2C-binding protein domain-containing protein [Rozella allomycis CSF55]|uniref:Ubiquitin-conjugating enzyme E2C-binding protein domain-containing protein n=1 Tax=Rozella allomycis (strain CSF55) TaxID=988480 RepID=A0A075ANX6_ROZAC|nr:Ubiquitin-conjugating enzyme E2C-binding protein domain-containing protein [Rozella allomycis CSF55]|eukprot:EPZ31672.1 Ubiquitin-conjugating enzyme E2C-binding protein domain-containing protein [Rozella allomycis CSF55]